MPDAMERVRFYVEAWRACSGLLPVKNRLHYPRKGAPIMAAFAMMYANLYGISIELFVPCSRECFQIQQDASFSTNAEARKAVMRLRFAAETRLLKRS
jgi:hypothetical protein